MKALIVDDNAADRRLLQLIFQHRDWTVIEARDGQEGLELALCNQPDIIVSDALMPGMDGFQFLRALNAAPENSGIPFLFYSASYTGQQENELAMSLGAEAFLPKPMDPDQLWAEIERIMTDRKTGAKTRQPLENEGEEQFLREYSLIVAAKLEEKVAELEKSLLRSEAAEGEVRRLNAELEQRVMERTAAVATKGKELEESRRALLNLVEDLNRKAAELEAANKALSQEILQRQHDQLEIVCLNDDLQRQKQALESFSYAVSHDLRTPLRHITSYVGILFDEFDNALEPEARHCLERINWASIKMHELIDALLKLSLLSRSEMVISAVDLSNQVVEIAAALQQSEPARQVEFTIAPGVTVMADKGLMHVVLENLVGNAWKYSRQKENTSIEFGTFTEAGKKVCYVKDNGAGFDMAGKDRLFEAFQRLHADSEFEGSGIGLATVKRIIDRHGGKVWAEGEVDSGATFYFTLDRAPATGLRESQ